jgi:hypothetical protein
MVRKKPRENRMVMKNSQEEQGREGNEKTEGVSAGNVASPTADKAWHGGKALRKGKPLKGGQRHRATLPGNAVRQPFRTQWRGEDLLFSGIVGISQGCRMILERRTSGLKAYCGKR